MPALQDAVLYQTVTSKQAGESYERSIGEAGGGGNDISVGRGATILNITCKSL